MPETLMVNHNPTTEKHRNPLLQKEVELLMRICDMQENGVEPPSCLIFQRNKNNNSRDVYRTRSKGAPSSTPQWYFWIACPSWAYNPRVYVVDYFIFFYYRWFLQGPMWFSYFSISLVSFSFVLYFSVRSGPPSCI